MAKIFSDTNGISAKEINELIEIFKQPLDGKKVTKLFVKNSKLEVEYEIQE